jgi:hypothetical protein
MMKLKRMGCFTLMILLTGLGLPQLEHPLAQFENILDLDSKWCAM